ncbi:hypothetical protein T4A_1080 [Trichinella pseudospiralis]|uniref:Uncharacterized protein n=1 Tax=Trichinella pseudospiralis TaxID=6337 RepID=A0A0V1DSH4_TRIPS|nr:hypothetical protein T4A_1080 [Trichinella pseudospiralis]
MASKFGVLPTFIYWEVAHRDTISASSGIHVGRDPLLSGECRFC